MRTPAAAVCGMELVVAVATVLEPETELPVADPLTLLPVPLADDDACVAEGTEADISKESREVEGVVCERRRQQR